MKKYLFLILFGLLFLLPSKASALYIDNIAGINDHDGYKFVVHAYNDEANTVDYIKDTTDIRIDIYGLKPDGNDDVFEPGDYGLILRRTSDNFVCWGQFTHVGLGPSVGVANHQTDSKKISFQVYPKGPTCSLEPSTYYLEIWSTGFGRRLWFKDVKFPIQSPAGGSSAKLVQVGSGENLVCPNKTTEARIENAEQGKMFNVWWDGDTTNFAWQGKADQRSFPIPLSGGDGKIADRFKSGTQPKLCMIEGDTILPPGAMLFGYNCASSPNLNFVYTDDINKCAANSEKKCRLVKIDPLLNNTVKKQAVLEGTNFPTDIATFRGDLVDTKNPTAEPKRFSGLKKSANGTVTVNTGELALGTYLFNFYAETGDPNFSCQVSSFTIDEKVETGNPESKEPKFESTQCLDGKCAKSSGEFCNTGTGKAVKDGDPIKSGDGILTAIGCIPTDPGKFVAGLMKYITGFSGGVALLLMVFGSFQMMTSAGNAETLKKGREQFVSAVIGLLFVIFSVLLMQIIGVDILGLPGFSK